MALLELATAVLERLGYAGLALLVALENLIPPIPSELILPLAGVLVQQGRFSFPLAVAAATFGSVAGAWVLYEVGRRLDEQRVQRFVARWGPWLLLEEEDYTKARHWFDRHGSLSVVLGRLLPGARSFVSIPAGLTKMARPRFLALTAMGAFAWNTALIAVGMAVGSATEQVEGLTDALEAVVLLVLVALLARLVWRRLRKGRAPRKARA